MHHYFNISEQTVSRAEFEENLLKKTNDPVFQTDMHTLLADELTWDADQATSMVMDKLVSLIPGAPWKLAKEFTGV